MANKTWHKNCQYHLIASYREPAQRGSGISRTLESQLQATRRYTMQVRRTRHYAWVCLAWSLRINTEGMTREVTC